MSGNIQYQFKHGSLFSGIGGFDLAAEWMGWENVFHCEWNEFGQRVLKYYWPKAQGFTDIKKTDFTNYANEIDILTGGFPCQPYSQSGKRLGKEDDRHLWPEMLRAIREISPSWVVGENVRGLVNWNGGMVFDEVQADLEVEGYEVQPFILPAAGVNAPHRRDRVWFIAYSDNTRTNERLRADGNRQKENERREEQPRFKFGSIYKSDTPNPTSESSGRELQKRQEQRKSRRCDCKTSSNPDSGRQSSEEHREEKSRQYSETSLSEWFKNFPTQSPICGGNDGIPQKLVDITFPKWRNESIKAFGNAVVPQEVIQIFKAIENYTINYT